MEKHSQENMLPTRLFRTYKLISEQEKKSVWLFVNVKQSVKSGLNPRPARNPLNSSPMSPCKKWIFLVPLLFISVSDGDFFNDGPRQHSMKVLMTAMMKFENLNERTNLKGTAEAAERWEQKPHLKSQ